MKIILKSYKLNGAIYYVCKNDDQNYLLAHLLNGALFNGIGVCLYDNELEEVKKLAHAHGWEIEIQTKKPKK